MSTTENTPTALAANKAVVERFFSAFNDQTPDVFDEVISPDYVDYGHEPPGRGPQGARDDYNGTLIAAGHIEWVIDDMVAEGDRVALEVTSSGDLKNGRLYRQEYHFLMEFRDGKISAVREYLDTQHAHAVWIREA